MQPRGADRATRSFDVLHLTSAAAEQKGRTTFDAGGFATSPGYGSFVSLSASLEVQLSPSVAEGTVIDEFAACKDVDVPLQ